MKDLFITCQAKFKKKKKKIRIQSALYQMMYFELFKKIYLQNFLLLMCKERKYYYMDLM